uniref:Uncharacterized protein n=1 Tax=Romanomermis culicivorax TaxID=13658 RepID=A0A915JRI7_ROMCU
MQNLEDITSDEEEVVVDEDLENIAYEEEEEEEEEEEVEEEEEKTLNNNISDEQGTILDYDDDENDQYKSYTPHSSDEEEIYEPVPIGSGGIHNAHQYLRHNDFLKDRHCIIQINNTDDLRFARALVVARAYVHKKDRNDVYKLGMQR